VFRTSDANGQGEANLVAHASTDGDGDLGWCAEEMGRAGDLEECLIYRYTLDPGGEVVKDRHHIVTKLLVPVEMATDEEEITAKLAGAPP
jgi:hypothetical protein